MKKNVPFQCVQLGSLGLGNEYSGVPSSRRHTWRGLPLLYACPRLLEAHHTRTLLFTGWIGEVFALFIYQHFISSFSFIWSFKQILWMRRLRNFVCFCVSLQDVVRLGCVPDQSPDPGAPEPPSLTRRRVNKKRQFLEPPAFCTSMSQLAHTAFASSGLTHNCLLAKA
jgi:hypothetical protein